MVAPTFLGIGAMKAGTTTVHTYLSMHPKVFVPKIKEVDWFGSSSKPQSEYEKIFPAKFAVRGEITPGYCNHLDMISALYPDVKLIFCVRNPVNRFISALRHLRTKAAERKVKNQGYLYDVDRIIARGHENFIMQQGYYQDTILKVFSQIFAPSGPRQRLHVIDFDRLIGNQQMVWDKLCDFLSVPPHKVGYLHSHSSNRDAYFKVTITDKQREALNAFYKPSNDFMRQRYHVEW